MATLLKEATDILQYEPGWTEDLMREEELFKVDKESIGQDKAIEKKHAKKKGKSKK